MNNHDEYKLPISANPDATPLDDDELEDVAGGISKANAADAKAAAEADGRKIMLPNRGLCLGHSRKYQFAKTCTREHCFDVYRDVKCYKPGCGKTTAKIEVRVF